VALAVSLALIDMDAMALGFGEPQVASALGQPLRMRIPLRVDGDLEVSSQCMRLIGAATGDTLPTLSQARLTIEEHGAERSLRIDSLLPVSEPSPGPWCRYCRRVRPRPAWYPARQPRARRPAPPVRRTSAWESPGSMGASGSP
jgi:hypothetical protein